ncbi:MAG TPA: hypothetical protein VGR78_09175 [Verrucomicrobiae bacterium]|nr:hypothetical protein [Verrucomicrobiae bacterium]
MKERNRIQKLALRKNVLCKNEILPGIIYDQQLKHKFNDQATYTWSEYSGCARENNQRRFIGLLLKSMPVKALYPRIRGYSGKIGE